MSKTHLSFYIPVKYSEKHDEIRAELKAIAKQLKIPGASPIGELLARIGLDKMYINPEQPHAPTTNEPAAPTLYEQEIDALLQSPGSIQAILHQDGHERVADQLNKRISMLKKLK